MSQTKVWAHRGASGYAPENTLEAFQLAVDMQVDGIELDVQLSKDGELVVIHDETIDRVSNGKGRVKDYTLQELRNFNFNNGHSTYAFAAIPTLEEVYNLLGNTGAEINVEFKTGNIFYEGIEEKALKLAQSMRIQNRIWYSSFNHYSAMHIKRLDSEAKVGLLYSDGFIDVPEYGYKLGAEAIHPTMNNLKYPTLFEDCKKYKLNIHVWNIRDDDIKFCCEQGVNAVITNYPDRTKKLIYNNY